MATDIKLSVDLEAGDVTSAAEELKERVRKLFENTAGNETSAKLDELLLKVKSLYEPFDELYNKAEAMKGATFVPDGLVEVSNEITEINKSFQALKQSAFSMRQIIEEFKQTHGTFVENTVAYKKEQTIMAELSNQYANTSKAVEFYKTQLQSLEQQEESLRTKAEKTGSEQDILRWSKVADQIKLVKNNIEQSETQLAKLNTQAVVVAENLQKLKDAKPGLIFEAKDAHKLRSYEQTYERVKEAMFANRDAMKEARAEAVKLRQEIKKAEDTDEYKEIIQNLDEVVNKLTVATKKTEEFNDAGGKLGSEFGLGPKRSIVDLFNNIKSLSSEIENFFDGLAKTLPPHIQVIYSIVKAAIKTIVGFIINEIKTAFNTLVRIVKTGLIKALNMATSAVKALVKELFKLTSGAILSPFKRLGDAISNLGKQANRSTPSLKQIGRAFLQYGLGARSLYRLINKLRTALFEGFGDLALVDEPFNAAMSSIVSSLEYLKNAFAAAFAPIIQAVAPALSTFINMVAQAVTWVGQLIALLTGQPFKIAVPTFKDYASSTSAGAAAAKSAAKAEKDRANALKKTAKEMRTIAGFDDVEILKAPDDNDSSSSSPSSGGGGGGGGGGLAFQTAPISEGLQKFADMLKKIWKTADAYDLGVLFSKKFRDLLRAFNEAVPKIQTVATKIAKILASFLAGFLSVPETFVELGKAIGNVINIVFTTINEFLKKFYELDGFKNLGRDIYLTIMNALKTIDWETIYSAFALMGIGIAQVLNETITKPDLWEAVFIALCNALRAVLIRIINFSSTLQWGDIGSAIANGVIAFIQNFPADEFITAVSTFLGGLWTAFCNFVDGMEGHWTEVGSLIANLIIGLFENFNPEEFARGVIAFLDGLWDAFMGFVETPGWDQVVDKIQKTIVTFAEEFEWEGKVDGLITFLNNAIGALVKILDKLDLPKFFDELYAELRESEEFEQLCDNIVQLFIDWLKLKIKAKFTLFTGIGDSIMRIISGGQIDSISDLAQQAVESQYDATNGAVNDYNQDFENLGADGIADPIATGMENGASDIVAKASSINDDIIKTMEDGAYEDTATDNMQKYTNGIDAQKATIHNSATDIQTDTTKTLGTGDYVLIGSDNISNYNRGMVGIRSTVQGSVRTISTDVQTTLQSGDYTGMGANVTNDFGTGINDGRDNVVNSAETIADGIYDTFMGKSWYDIGDNIIEGIWDGIKGGWDWLESKVHDLAIDLYNAACNALGIHSPSKVFAEKVGEMIPAGIGLGIIDNEKSATSSVETMAQSLVDSAKNIKLPPIAMGEVIPSNIANQYDNSQNTLSSLLSVLQSLQSDMVTRSELEEMLTDMFRTHMNIDFYIGDEKLARHANKGNSLLDRRYNPVKS